MSYNGLPNFPRVDFDPEKIKQNLKSYMDSPEGQAELAELKARNLKARRKRRRQKVLRYILDNVLTFIVIFIGIATLLVTILK